MYFFYLLTLGITVVQFISPVVAQNYESTSEQVKYAPNKWDQFSVFREVQWKQGEPEPEFPGLAASNVAFLDFNFSKIPDRFFDQLPQLEVLVVRNGTLEELKVKNGMKIVHAEKNQITSLRIEGSGEMLKELYVQENPLRNINPIVSSLKGLEVLDLSSTNVAVQNDETIDLSLFASLPNLTELYLKNMQAHYVENAIRATLSKLKRLDLSGNPIISNSLELDAFRTIPNLEELYLRDTMITHLEFSDIREDLPALKRLYLDGNNFPCDKLKLLLTHLKEKGIDTPTKSRKRDLGYENIDGLRCLYTMKNVPRKDIQRNVTPPPKDNETAATTDTTNEYVDGIARLSLFEKILVICLAVVSFFWGWNCAKAHSWCKRNDHSLTRMC